MKVLLSILLFSVAGLYAATWFISQRSETKFPAIGNFKRINGANLHFVDTGFSAGDEKPAVVFIHGAGGNLRDQMVVYNPLMQGKARAIFIDRPGQGYSEPFSGSNDPKEQASSTAKLLDELGIEKAVIVGHSFGGVIAGAFGVLYPEKTAGLVFVAPVAYPWPGGVDWHYDVGNVPVAGWLFSNLVAVPAGNFIYPSAIKRLFAPNQTPADYETKSGTRLLLRPATFYENAKDVARVFDHVSAFHPRYKEITAPTYIFHGNEDDVVSHEIHSINGLSKDIKNFKGLAISPTM